MYLFRLNSLAGLLACFFLSATHAGEWSGHISFEARVFEQDGPDAQQDKRNVSFSVLPEYYSEWNNGNDSLTFEPFVRIDSDDRERSHADIRELMWLHVGNDWEFHLGIGKVFWGVTEAQHLVDIVNQTDLVENLDGEDKLGQPMMQLSFIRDWGVIDFFVLPGFRQRTFPGRSGRLRSTLAVDTDLDVYQSSRKQRHVDWVARWSHTIDIWDIGVSHFSGTSRDPELIQAIDSSGNRVLAPFYDQIRQTGIDVQATMDDWLLKMEWISRNGKRRNSQYTALAAGFEYTFVGINGSAQDLGILMEYLYDERGKQAPGFFEDDLFVGARWVWNDSQDTQALAGLVLDADSSEYLFRLEASHRVGESTTLSVEARFFSNIPDNSTRAVFDRESFIQMELAWYF